ncbi:TetR-like C-terminal domain-containing protein [Paenibacillus sp. V4I5]|uniref:TetR-like C-terminal domain-containing protein n=1 Tax=Paenibacillus sp. V4I5 TaxID=3042306 RepID=UPI00359377C0
MSSLITFCSINEENRGITKLTSELKPVFVYFEETNCSSPPTECPICGLGFVGIEELWIRHKMPHSPEYMAEQLRRLIERNDIYPVNK